MDPLYVRVCSLLLIMEILVGTVANGSIVLINFFDWFKSRKLSPTDLILICLGLSRLLLQAVLILLLTAFVLLDSTPGNVLFTLTGIWIYTNAVNLWFAACLSVFYLAKIAIFSHPVFLQAKRRVSRLVPWMLLGSVGASAVKTIIVMTIWNYDLFACDPYKSHLSNRSIKEIKMPPMCGHVTALISVFNSVPFMVFLSSSIFLIRSLWKHMRRLQRNGTGTRDLSTQAHLGALKALASFAVLYLISFAAITSHTLLVWNNQYTWTIVLMNVSAVYPSGHAIVLILINPKLKQTWVKMVHHLKCHWRKIPS